MFFNTLNRPTTQEYTFLDRIQNLGKFNPDYNVPLTGNVTITNDSNTFQYLDPNSTNRILDFNITGIIPGKIHLIIHTGVDRRFNVYTNGVDTGFRIRRNQVWLAHFTDDWNFFRLV